MKFERWLKTFVDEKGLDTGRIYEITHEKTGVLHMIELETLIVYINTASENEQKMIRHTITMIDFQNGDINHFFNYLANAYVQENC